MSTHRLPQIKRLHRLRLLEEERDESILSVQQQLRRHCLQALEDCDAQKAEASRALHTSLEAGDQDTAMAAEMAMTFDPLRRGALTSRLVQLDALIDERTTIWQASRMRRRQMETVLKDMESTHHSELLRAEQKSMDGWFLSAGRSSASIADEADESFQRESLKQSPDHGPRTAMGDVE